MLLQPNKKTLKKLREVLNDLYKHLDSSAAAIIDVSVDRISLEVFLSFVRMLCDICRLTHTLGNTNERDY